MALTSSNRGGHKRPSTLSFIIAICLLAAAIVWASGQDNIPINEPGHFSPAPSVSAS